MKVSFCSSGGGAERPTCQCIDGERRRASTWQLELASGFKSLRSSAGPLNRHTSNQHKRTRLRMCSRAWPPQAQTTQRDRRMATAGSHQGATCAPSSAPEMERRRRRERGVDATVRGEPQSYSARKQQLRQDKRRASEPQRLKRLQSLAASKSRTSQAHPVDNHVVQVVQRKGLDRGRAGAAAVEEEGELHGDHAQRTCESMLGSERGSGRTGCWKRQLCADAQPTRTNSTR